MVKRKDNYREFPFDTSGTANSLTFRGYGKGLKSAAKLTALLPTDTLFTQTGKSLNAWKTKADFLLDTAVYSDVAQVGSPTAGCVEWTFAKATWGG